MKTIVIGDVHGCYNELKTLITNLKESGEYNKDEDKLVFLGDYIDRGKDSRLVIKFIKSLQEENKNVIALKGNHEDMLLEFYKGIDTSWKYNGYKYTMDSYKGYEEQFGDDIEWMANLPLYHEDDNFIYVHAGIDFDLPMEEQDKDTLLWVRNTFIYDVKEYPKKVIFGHTPTMNLNQSWKPMYTFTNNIDIDTGCVYGGMLTALIIEGGKVKEFYQVEKEEDEDSFINNYYKSIIM